MDIGVLNFLVSSSVSLTGRVILNVELSRIEYVNSYLPLCLTHSPTVGGLIVDAKVRNILQRTKKRRKECGVGMIFFL